MNLYCSMMSLMTSSRYLDTNDIDSKSLNSGRSSVGHQQTAKFSTLILFSVEYSDTLTTDTQKLQTYCYKVPSNITTTCNTTRGIIAVDADTGFDSGNEDTGLTCIITLIEGIRITYCIITVATDIGLTLPQTLS